MALPELRGTGRLLCDVRTGTTSTDKPYASALIKFPQWRKVDGQWEEGDGAVASVVAYDDHAIALARYAKGDDIGIHGTVKPAVYRDKPQLSITASQIWTPEKTSRPAAKTAASTTSTRGLAAARTAASASLRAFDAKRLSAQRAESAA